MKSICILILLLASITTLAYAVPDVTDSDYNETKLIETPKGAEVRLLMLERQIVKNIEDGEHLLNQINDTNVSNELGLIIDELEYLLNQTGNLDLNKTPKELAEEYVLLKAEATDLTSQFRQLFSTVKTAPERNLLRMQMRNQERNRVRGVDSQLQQAKNKYNAQQFGYYCDIIDCEAKMFRNRTRDVTQLQEEIAEGNIPLEELNKELATLFAELDAEEQIEVKQKINERATKNTVAAKVLQTRIRTNMNATFENRLSERHKNMGIQRGGNGQNQGANAGGQNSNGASQGTNSNGNGGSGGNGGGSSGGSGGGSSGGSGSGNGGSGGNGGGSSGGSGGGSSGGSGGGGK